MQESYREDLASCSGLEPYADHGNVVGVASARGNAGQLLSSEIITGEGNIVAAVMWRGSVGRGGV